MREFGDAPQLREALLQSENRSGLPFENAPVAYLEIGSKGGIRLVNRAASALLGYGVEELLGKPLWELTLPEDGGSLRKLV